MEEIDVLLATYNGEMFIEKFLESLAGQEHVNIHLIVSDDGSTDSTLEIVKRNQSNFQKLTIINGPRKGPMANFFYLLRNSSRNFVALADQDDIWNKDHLKNSIERIRNDQLPSMTYTSVIEFDDREETRKIWPINYMGPEFPSIFFENTARGCTIVLNRHAIELINVKEPKHAVMHDWWILLLLQLYGKVRFEPVPELEYRLHENNYVGVSHLKALRFIRTIQKGSWLPVDQVREILDYPETKFQKIDTFDIEQFVGHLESNLFIRFTRISCMKGARFRQTFPDEIKIRLGIILFRALDRNRSTDQQIEVI